MAWQQLPPELPPDYAIRLGTERDALNARAIEKSNKIGLFVYSAILADTPPLELAELLFLDAAAPGAAVGQTAA